MGITVLALLTTWPVMQWLTAAPDFTRMTLVLLWGNQIKLEIPTSIVTSKLSRALRCSTALP
jgi:hypothetical protein